MYSTAFLYLKISNILDFSICLLFQCNKSINIIVIQSRPILFLISTRETIQWVYRHFLCHDRDTFTITSSSYISKKCITHIQVYLEKEGYNQKPLLPLPVLNRKGRRESGPAGRGQSLKPIVSAL